MNSDNVQLYDKIIEVNMDRHRAYPRPWYQPKPKKIKKKKLVASPRSIGLDPVFPFPHN